MSHIYPTPTKNNVIDGGIANYSWPGSTEDAIGTVPQPAAYATAASTILQFGIPDSVVLAPIHPPPPKKRKTNDEFTILERLEILSELKQTGPNAISVPALAAKHRTSRTSIYRWKKDLPRLLKLSKKSDDTKHKKRVPIKKTKGNRKSTYNEEFSASQKLMAIRELSTSSSSASGGNGVGIDGGSAPAPPSVRAVAAKIGANYRSLYRWKKDEQKLIQLVEQEGKGNCKRLVRDPMGRVKGALKLFYESQQQQQHQRASDDGNVNGVPPLTGTLLALKGKQIRDEMLAQHEITPFLSEMELKGMREFTGSASWGRKVLHTLVAKEDDDDDGAMTGGMFNEQQQHHPQQQQPPLWDAAPSQPTNATSKSNRKKASLPTQQQQQKIRDLKREITLLKKNLQGCEVRVHELENENAALRAQVASMMNGDDGDGAFEQEEDDEERGGEDEDVEEEGGEDDGYTEYY